MIAQKMTLIGLLPLQIEKLHKLFNSEVLLYHQITSFEIGGLTTDELTKWFDGAPRLPLAKLESCVWVKKHRTYTVEIHILVEAEIINPPWNTGREPTKEKFSLRSGFALLKTIYETLDIFPVCTGMSILSRIPEEQFREAK